MRRNRLVCSVGAALIVQVLTAGGALGQSERDSLPGWERFVEPLLKQAESGVAFFPGKFDKQLGRYKPIGILNPDGFRVHMTPADDPGEELVFLAGELVSPPPARFRIWMASEWEMTPFSRLIAFASHRSKIISPVPLPTIPAGRVTVDEEWMGTEDLDLWLPYGEGSGRGYELSRRRPTEELADGLLIASGSAVAGLWDRRQERWVALSRPFSVRAGEGVPAPLAQPSRHRSWLKAYITRPAEGDPKSHFGLILEALSGGESHAPSLVWPTRWGLHAVWYDLEPGAIVLSGGSDELYLRPQVIELTGGEIEKFNGVLFNRPSLQVNLDLPQYVREEPLPLTVHRLPEGEVLASTELPGDSGGYRFTALEHGLLEVVLSTHVGPFRKQVDLTVDDEGFVILSPDLIEVFGTVYHGEEPHPATLEFQTAGRDLLQTTTDEFGEYDLFSLQPLTWVTVGLEGADREPWLDLLVPPVRKDGTLDIRIPDADVRVRVVDAKTGRGITGASVDVLSEYTPQQGSSPLKLVKTHSVDEDGFARLPSPRPGPYRHGVGGLRQRWSALSLTTSTSPGCPLSRTRNLRLSSGRLLRSTVRR